MSRTVAHLSATARNGRQTLNAVRVLPLATRAVAALKSCHYRRTPQRADAVVVQLLSSPLGKLLAAADTAGVCALLFADGHALPRLLSDLRRWFDRDLRTGDTLHLRRLRRELAEYFAGRRRQFRVPLSCRGTSFQQAVWSALREIPYGATASYADVARRIGRPGAQRAVGAANHANRIAILIPCHRVVNQNGGWGGYGGGLWRKRFLLALEGRRA